MSVLPSNTGTAIYNGAIVATQNFTFTVNSGDTLAVFFIVQDATQTISSVTWDAGGTNQSCAIVGSKSSTASSIYVYAITNPTVGTKTLSVVNGAATATSAEMQTFKGTVTSSVAAACTNALTANGITSAGGNYGTAAQSGSPGNILVGAFLTENNLVAVSNTPIYTLFPSSAKDAAANYYEVTTGASISLTANIYTSGVSWAAVSFNIVNGSPTISNLTASSLTPGGAFLDTPSPLGTYSMANVFASPSTLNPGATLSVSGNLMSTSGASVILQYLVREIVNGSSVNITTVNSSTLTLVANVPQAVNLSVVIPGTTAYDNYLIDVLVFTTDFSTTLLYVNTATTFKVVAVGTSRTFPFKLGVYKAAQDPTAIAAYENWLGHPVDLINDTIPSDSWDNMINGGWAYFASQWANDVSRMVVTIPMIPTFGDYGGTNMTDAAVSAALAAGASGTYDANWVIMRQDLINAGYGSNMIRLGWEMNGNWNNWRAVVNPTAWVTYWQRIVTILRNDPAAHFVFNFNPTAGQQVILADSVYPGDAYVDAIGLDIYDQDFRGFYPIPGTDTPAQALAAQQQVWTTDILGQFNYGLTFWSSFAATHGKPFTICEWGVYTPGNNGGGDDTYYIQSMHDYATNPANGVTALIYFDLQGLQALYDSPAQPTQFPNSSALYLQLFGSTLSPPVVLGDYALDFGMQSFHSKCDRIYICTGPITDFSSVISSSIGFKNFGVGNAFGGINNGVPSGRTVTSIAFSDGSATANGVASVWAAVDFTGSHLLAWGALSGATQVNSGQLFGMPSFIIHEPSVFSGVGISIPFVATTLASQAVGFSRPGFLSVTLSAKSLTTSAASLAIPTLNPSYPLTGFSFVPNHANSIGSPILNTKSVLTASNLAAGAAGFTGNKPTLSINGVAPTVVRNVFQQPFGINSIWNTPVGKGTGTITASGTGPHGGTQYKYSNNDGPVYEFAGKTVSNTASDENLLLFGPASPLRPLYGSTVEWNGNAAARCSATQASQGISLPIPINASYPGSGSAAVSGSTPNCSAAILEANRRTVYQTQPLQICVVGGTTTGSVTTGSQYPQFIAAINTVDIFADEVNLFTGTKTSAIGSHGGGWMSALGGTIRLNEIMPGNCPFLPGVSDVIRHSLSVSMNNNLFQAFTSTFVWPAIHNDPGNEGLLLSLLPTFDINSLLTAPGKSLAWNLINFGWYIVDASAWDAINLDTEYSWGDSSVNCPTGRVINQFQSAWGFSIIPEPNSGTNFGKDILTICANFYVITNNGPTNIGGTGSSGLYMQPKVAPAVDPGVITVVPTISNASFSISHTAASAVLLGQVIATNSPYQWAFSGTGASNFWIQPTTGLVYTAIANIPAGTYTLTATGTNIIGNGTGTVTIMVN